MPRSDQHWMNAVRRSRAKPSASSSEGVMWIMVSVIGVCVMIVTAVVLLTRTDTGGMDYDQEFIAVKGRSTEPPTIAPTVTTATPTVTTVAPTDTPTATFSPTDTPTVTTVAPTTANCAEERTRCENYCSVDSVCTTYDASVIDESSPENHDDCEQAMNDAKSACSS